jgi:hypothetical protein
MKAMCESARMSPEIFRIVAPLSFTLPQSDRKRGAPFPSLPPGSHAVALKFAGNVRFANAQTEMPF